MANNKYLLRRGEAWFFRMAVPTDLRDRFGAKVVQSLHTADPAEARRLRWPKREAWTQAFERARQGVPLTVAEIDVEARQAYQATLDALALANRLVGSRLPPGVYQATEADELSAAADDCYRALGLDDIGGAPDFSLVTEDIAAIAGRKGVAIEPGGETWRLLGEALLRARIAAFNGRIAALDNKPSEPPAAFVRGGINPRTLQPIAEAPRPKRRHGEAGKTFSEVAALYIAELQRDPSSKLTEQVRGQRESVFRLFEEHSRNAALGDVDRGMASDFLDSVAKLDPNWSRQGGARSTLKELLQRYRHGGAGLSNQTLNRYAQTLSGLFKWALRRGHYDGANPFSEQARKGKSAHYVPFTVDELNALLASPPSITLRWIPFISLFSGMRQNEICQLRTTDLQRDGKIWFFNVAEDAEGQSVKTEAGLRRVPVHSALIRCGLLDYHKALPAGQLFPSLKSGGADGKFNSNFSSAFKKYRRRVEVDRPRVAFHSFRNCVITNLDNAGVARSDIGALVGHERGFTLDVYSKGLRLPRLQELVEKIGYPGLRLAR
jgi:integrase